MKFRAFLASVNPLAVYREERERDREVLLAVVREASTVMQGAVNVLLAQQQLMNQFLQNFKTDDLTTRSWTITEEQDLERVAAGLGMSVDEYLKSL